MSFSFKAFYRNLGIRERRFVILVIVGALFLSTVPYLYGWAVAGARYTYLWLYPNGPADTNVYFSFIKQVTQGHFFIENLHTSEPQNGSIVHPLWLLLGWIAGLFRLSIPFIFHVARIIMGAIFLFAAYGFFGMMFESPRRRMIAFILLAFSSGIGTFFSIGINGNDGTQILLLWPTDQWVTESNTFMTLMHSPLFIFSQLGMLLLFWAMLHEDRKKSFFHILALMAMLTLIHPYDIVTVFAFIAAFLLVRIIRDPSTTPDNVRIYLKRAVLLAVVTIPVAAYYYLSGKIEPAIGDWSKQNITTSPPIHNYILGFGFLIPLALVGALELRRSRRRVDILVLTWMITGLLLIYIPVQINRRFTNGLHIPMVILAAIGIDLLWGWMSKRFVGRTILQHAALSLVGWIAGFGLFFSSVTTIARAVYYSSDPSQSFYFERTTATHAMSWLERYAPPQSIVLSTSFTGNIIPARTGLRVYLGHGHQTIHYTEKSNLVTKWFYWTNGDDQKKLTFLRANAIGYVFYGPSESGKGHFRPDEKPYLKQVFAEGEDRVYAVLRDQN